MQNFWCKTSGGKLPLCSLYLAASIETFTPGNSVCAGNYQQGKTA
jgi:hypothetical protein